MSWLIYQTWLLLLISFILGAMTAWLAARYLPTRQPEDLDESDDLDEYDEPLPIPSPPRVDASARPDGEGSR